jgi:putative nucleotidyltransferase with HDIG domain
MASERSESAPFGLTSSPFDLARSLLEVALPRRWAHSQGVGHQAVRIAPVVDTPAVLAAAAILHDIGYAPDLVDTGFHPVDGARYLRRLGADERVVSLVAHHSCAAMEAEERQLSDALAVSTSARLPTPMH